jgi:TonB family protein
MPLNYSPGRTNFGLLPEPDRSPISFIASMGVNGLILAALLLIGAMAKQVIVEHRYENTVLILPTPPPPTPRVKLPEPPKIKPPKPPEVKLESPKIDLPKPKPDMKPIEMEAKVNLPIVKASKPAVVLAPQPKAAMPAQTVAVKPSTAPVHLGDTFGVTPNPNASRPATVAAIGNLYGGAQGLATAPHGVVGSTGIGNGLRSGTNGGGGIGYGGSGRVASAGLPSAVTATPIQQVGTAPASTSLEIISKPPVQYTSEARQLRIQGDVVLRVTFTAGGQVVVQGVLRGLGHGLDEEARRVAQQIQFRPATRNGQPTDLATNITITFQLT